MIHCISMNAYHPELQKNPVDSKPIRTKRLELIPASLAILESDLEDRAGLSRLLDATIPVSWPPPLLDTNALTEFVRMKREKSDPQFITWYWVRVDPVTKTRTLIGSGGISSSALADSTVMIGYSVLDEFQNQGYATEAIQSLIPIIFSLSGIRKIMATTYPDLVPSIRVLEKNKFSCAGPGYSGEGMEEGTLAFIREKPGIVP
ncbi:MAG: GNAT family N-acetyltransferase [Methanoregula sp.]|nr:GNAT family N-acetyltransferase [Methanoregula sp.]